LSFLVRFPFYPGRNAYKNRLVQSNGVDNGEYALLNDSPNRRDKEEAKNNPVNLSANIYETANVGDKQPMEASGYKPPQISSTYENVGDSQEVIDSQYSLLESSPDLEPEDAKKLHVSYSCSNKLAKYNYNGYFHIRLGVL